MSGFPTNAESVTTSAISILPSPFASPESLLINPVFFIISSVALNLYIYLCISPFRLSSSFDVVYVIEKSPLSLLVTQVNLPSVVATSYYFGDKS